MSEIQRAIIVARLMSGKEEIRRGIIMEKARTESQRRKCSFNKIVNDINNQRMR